MTDMILLGEFLTTLRSACESRLSAAFFITTENHHSAMITLSHGQITGLKYRFSRGYDAASAIAKVSGLRFRQAEGPTELPGEAALNTSAVLEILSEGAASAPTGAGNGLVAGGVNLKALRTRYMEAIGPIGGMLFDETVVELGDSISTPEGLNELLNQLAAQIDDQAESRSFISDARTL